MLVRDELRVRHDLKKKRFIAQSRSELNSCPTQRNKLGWPSANNSAVPSFFLLLLFSKKTALRFPSLLRVCRVINENGVP